MTNPLVAMFEGSPVMVAREHKAQFESCLQMAATHPQIDAVMSDAASTGGDGFWPEADSWRASLRPYNVTKEGILLLPVKGVLLHDFPWQLGNWATGYEYIWRAFERGMDDPSVRGIALMIHSPGGLVAGNQVLVDKMYARRDEKPVRAYAQEYAYSAAYNIFSVAPYGLVSSTGGVGSIGVMTSHVDWSKFNERLGVKFTFVFAGAHKVEGNPEEPLSDGAKARIQARVDELYEVFVSSVARNRGMDEKAVRDTEALTFSATQATSNGLADAVGSSDEALSAFADFLDEPSDNGEEEMTTPNPAVDQAAHETAVASARTEGATSGKTDERTRISAILTCDEADGRSTLANHLAFKTDMSVEDAKGMLAVAEKKADEPAQTTPAAKEQGGGDTTFAGAMDKTDNPNVGAGDGNEQADQSGNADPVLALVRAAGLGGFKPAPDAKN